MLYMVTFTINIPPMLAYIPYMDPMGMGLKTCLCLNNKLMHSFAGQISSFVACVFLQKMIYHLVI